MNEENQKTSRRLTRKPLALSWEFVLLLMLMVTVLGVALRSPMKTFPRQDPYDLRSERTVSDAKNRVVTGL